MLRLSAALMAVFFCLLPVSGWAAPSCGTAKQLIKTLTETHKETPVVTGRISDKVIYQVWRSDKGDFTAISIGVDGSACIWAKGTDLEVVPFLKGGPET